MVPAIGDAFRTRAIIGGLVILGILLVMFAVISPALLDMWHDAHPPKNPRKPSRKEKIAQLRYYEEFYAKDRRDWLVYKELGWERAAREKEGMERNDQEANRLATELGMRRQPIDAAAEKRYVDEMVAFYTKDLFRESADKQETIKEEIKQPQPPESFRLGDAMWRNKDHDQPIVVTGYLGQTNGLHYVSIAGTTTGIPLSEVFYPAKADTNELRYPTVPADRWSNCDPLLKQAIGWLYTYVPTMRKGIDAILEIDRPLIIGFGETTKAAAWALRDHRQIKVDQQYRTQPPRLLAPLLAHEWRHLTSMRVRGATKEAIVQAFREEMECEKQLVVAWKILKRPGDSGPLFRLYEGALKAIETGKLREHVIMSPFWQENILGEEI